MNAAVDFIAPNTPEWVATRRGCLGASRIYDATRKLKNGNYPEARATLMTELAIERLTDRATEHYVSAAMQWGTDHEPQAIDAYTWETGHEVRPLGWVPHPTIQWTGCTPDGGVGDDGLIECKCPNTATHVQTLLTRDIDPQYQAQMQWQLACTGRSWNDYVTFDPRMPKRLELWILRVERNAKVIAELEAEARKFLDELADMIQKLGAI